MKLWWQLGQTMFPCPCTKGGQWPHFFEVDSPPKHLRTTSLKEEMKCKIGTGQKQSYSESMHEFWWEKSLLGLIIFFLLNLWKKINSGFSLIFFSKEIYKATSNLFQMDLVIEWLIIHSAVSYVVKLWNLQQTGLELCFMVSGRKDNP